MENTCKSCVAKGEQRQMSWSAKAARAESGVANGEQMQMSWSAKAARAESGVANGEQKLASPFNLYFVCSGNITVSHFLRNQSQSNE
jgi:hypothetical protein